MKTRTAGFTLIELLVVIAIIAILAAILFPVFARVKQTAMLSSCSSNIRQMGIAVQLYSESNDGRLPQYKRVYAGSPPKHVWWYDACHPYMKAGKVYRCPALMYSKGAEITQFGENARVYGYGVNYPHVFVEAGYYSNKLSQIPRASKTMMICDAYTMGLIPSTLKMAECGFGVVYCRGTQGGNGHNWVYGSQYMEDGNVAGRHGGNSASTPYGSTVMLYCDMHAKVWPKEYVIQEYSDKSDCRNADIWAHCDGIIPQRIP